MNVDLFARFRTVAYAVAPFFWNAVSSVALQGGTLIANVVLVRLISPGQFGAFSITQNLLTTIASFSTLGLALTGNRYVALLHATSPARSRTFHQGVVVLTCLLGIVAGACTILFANSLGTSVLHDLSLAPMIALAGLAVPFACVVTVQAGLFAGYGAFRKLALGSVLQGVLALLGVSVGAASAGAAGAVAGLGVSIALRGLLNLAILPAPAGPGMTGDTLRSLAAEIYPFALPAALSGLTLFPAAWVANALLVRNAGTSSFAVFAVYFLIKNAITFLPLQTGAVLLSRLARQPGSPGGSASRYQFQVTALTAAIAAAGALLVAVFPHEIFHIVAPRLAPNVTVFRCYILTAVLEPLAILAAYRVAAKGNMWRSLSFYALPKDALLVVLAITLIPRFGALGLALAYTTSWLLGLTAATLLARSAQRPVSAN